MADTASAPPPSAIKRLVWSDLEAMMRAGIIHEGGPEELLDGELWVHGEPLRLTPAQIAQMRAIGVLAVNEAYDAIGGGRNSGVRGGEAR